MTGGWRCASIAIAVTLLAACGEKGSNGGTIAKTPASSVAATFDGLGRARIGTSVAQLREIGSVPKSTGSEAACRVVTLDWLPSGVHVMLVNDSVARIDVDSTSAVRTIDGAGVGDSETRIHQFYASIQTQPNKYAANGRDLIVTSPNDSSRRIVFETDGAAVKRYRVGRRPEVDFVEGCG